MKEFLLCCIAAACVYLYINKDVTPEPYKKVETTIDFGKLKEILELSVINQQVTVNLDTILIVEKSFWSKELEFSEIFNEPQAELKLTLPYTVKIGFNFEKVQITDSDTIIIKLPEPEIFSIENQFDSTICFSGLHNGKYISDKQRVNCLQWTKNRVKDECEKRGLFEIATLKGKEKISDFFYQFNQNIIIE